MKKRGIWLYLFMLFALWMSVFKLLLIANGALRRGSFYPDASDPAAIILGIIFLAIPIAGIAGIVGTLMLKKWGRLIMLGVFSVWLIRGIVSFFIAFNQTTINLQGFFMGLGILIVPNVMGLYYLTNAKVKQNFS